MFFRVALLALWQSYYCPSACEVTTIKDMNKSQQYDLCFLVLTESRATHGLWNTASICTQDCSGLGRWHKYAARGHIKISIYSDALVLLKYCGIGPSRLYVTSGYGKFCQVMWYSCWFGVVSVIQYIKCALMCTHLRIHFNCPKFK